LILMSDDKLPSRMLIQTLLFLPHKTCRASIRDTTFKMLAQHLLLNHWTK